MHQVASKIKRIVQRLFHPSQHTPKAAGDPAEDYSYLEQNKHETDDYSLFRGYFDGVRYENGEVVVNGWMISLLGPYKPVVLFINDLDMGTAELVERPDVAHRLPHIQNSLYCGFRFRIPMPVEQARQMMTISVRGLIQGQEMARMETWFIADLYERMPAPPPNLINRVDEMRDPEFYLLKGIQNYGELQNLINRNTDPQKIETMLDWGCGSGRLSAFFIEFSGIPQIYGCDIDAEAVKWCRQNLRGQFEVIPLHPPTQYESEQFDLIVSFSVLTHLSREVQNEWLAEMQRILRPGGLFIATVHGIIAARTILPKQDVQSVLQNGIHDGLIDHRLAGIAPEDYYRAVFQSKDYIHREWSNHFEILDHIEQGASNYHDIVVMRKRSE